MISRRTVIVAIALGILLSSAIHGVAWSDAEGGFTSQNLKWLARVQVGGFTEGGRHVGRHLYVTDDARGLVIFDVSNPEAPLLVGELNVSHILENEDIATNDRIALISQGWAVAVALGDEPASTLNVIDVSDPGRPHVVAQLPGAGDHTYECVLDCAYAYGGTAADIVDLREPAQPRIVGNWKDSIGMPRDTLTHDTTEVVAGKLLVAGNGRVYLLDTTDPVHPKLVAQSKPVDNSVIHTVHWPTNGSSEFILSSTESPAHAPHCTVNDGAMFAFFRVWEARNWQKDSTIELVNEWGPENGTYVDGDPTISTHGTTVTNNGCSTHWFEEHPRYAQNRLVALAAYGHGMKLLHIDSAGLVTAKGFFLPHFDDVGAAYWITDRIVYAVSFERGIDILCYEGPLHGEAPGTPSEC